MQNIQWAEIPVYLYVIFGIFTLCAFIQFYYYWSIFRHVVNIKPYTGKSTKPPVSVVICAKNEQQNLEKNLPLYLEQNYPEFEVVVVNDCSTDETEALLYTLKLKYKKLQVTTIELDHQFLHNKKLAITIGIKAARYDNIIFTEPYCAPSDNKWLASMQQAFGSKGELVVGYCRNEPREGLADKVMRSDSVVSALFSLHGAMLGKPYRCTIKNMGISQSFFFRSKGFAHYNSYPNSEETIFLCRNGNEENTRVAISSDAILSSSQVLTFEQWFKQKCLYSSLLSMGKRGVWRLRCEILSRTSFYTTFLVLLILAIIRLDYLLMLCMAPLVITRLITRMVIMRKALNKLQEKGIFFWILVYDIISPLLTFIVALVQPNLQKIKKIK